MKKSIEVLIAGALIGLLLYGSWIKLRSLEPGDGGLPLAIRWEGFYHDMNFRDIGESANTCLGDKVFREGMAYRAAGWFSGWSCDKVGDPDIIYSLNYSPQKSERYFCDAEGEKKIGRYFNPQLKLDDLEFLENWKDPELRQATCGFIRDIFYSLQQQKRVLLHCDAGRDRTGTLAALLIGLGAESAGKLDQQMLGAVECDYRKTESLVPEKYGRMERFLTLVREQHGSIGQFLNQQCDLPPSLIQEVGRNLLN